MSNMVGLQCAYTHLIKSWTWPKSNSQCYDRPNWNACWWRRSVVVSALASINVVNRHWARLELWMVTACGRVNHLGM